MDTVTELSHLKRTLSVVFTLLPVLSVSGDKIKELLMDGHVVYERDENSIKFWSKNLKGNCFGGPVVAGSRGGLM
jgi:hypothetical protein